MEKEGQRLATKDSFDVAVQGPTTTLSRWSSEPTSLSSGGSDEAAGADLLERTWRSVATLRHALEYERHRCRQLEDQLNSANGPTCTLTPATVDAVVRCVERDRCESRQLQPVVACQHDVIVKQRRQLRVCRQNADDHDDSLLSDFELVSLHPDCSDCAADNGRRTVRRRFACTDAACCCRCRTFRGLCFSVCVGRTGERCKIGWTDRDAVWEPEQTRVK